MTWIELEDQKVFIAAILGLADEQLAFEQPFLWTSTNGEDWNVATREYKCKVRV